MTPSSRQSRFRVIKGTSLTSNKHDRKIDFSNFCLSCQRRGIVCDMKGRRCGECARLHLKCEHSADSSTSTNKAGVGRELQESQPLLKPDTVEKRMENLISEPHLDIDFNYHDFLMTFDDFPDTGLLSDVFTESGNKEQLVAPVDEKENIGGRVQQGNTKEIFEIPFEMLKHHYVTNVSSAFSSKNSNWTFYSFIFHHYSQSHPFLLSSIFAWTSACLSVSKFQALKSMASFSRKDSFQHLRMSLGGLVRWLDDHNAVNGVSLKNRINANELLALELLPSFVDSVDYSFFEDLPYQDLDAVFSCCYFQLLFCVSMRQLQRFHDIMTFMTNIAKALVDPQTKKIAVQGVHARVCNWIAELDMKASLFGNKGGHFMDIILGTGLTSIADLSKDTLRHAYRTFYPKEETNEDTLHYPLMLNHLRQQTVLRHISRCEQVGNKSERIKREIQAKIVLLEETLGSITPYETGRLKMMYGVNVSLEGALKIYSNMVFNPDSKPYSEHKVAERMIRQIVDITQECNIPKARDWPLTIFLASLEVSDPVYYSWCIKHLKYAEEYSFNYEVLILLVHEFRSRQDVTGKRCKVSDIMDQFDLRLII